MGLKRIMFMAEATFAADDSRDLDTLASVTATAVSDGLVAQNGTLARITITGAAADPDPEPTADPVLPPSEYSQEEL